MKKITCLCLRGLPGSGKSYTAYRRGDDGAVVSADMFFMNNGEYKFDKARLGVAHAWCQSEAARLLRGGSSVVVDNTNLSQSELAVYAKIAVKAGAEFSVAYASAPWAMDIDECSKRNTHGVPKEALARMLARFWRPGESITLEEALHTPP